MGLTSILCSLKVPVQYTSPAGLQAPRVSQPSTASGNNQLQTHFVQNNVLQGDNVEVMGTYLLSHERCSSPLQAKHLQAQLIDLTKSTLFKPGAGAVQVTPSMYYAMELTGHTLKPGQLGSLKCLSAPFPHFSHPVPTRLIAELVARTDISRLAHEQEHSTFYFLLDDKLR